ncbi:MAG TPA: tetratricopeptide repeat protein [Gemmatimonas sp.]|uniref:tetratricopeptide repeat protein n=1 Tax=Gemmatimonas sp. TaxID=1962908 RepID=UPI002ED7C4B3
MTWWRRLVGGSSARGKGRTDFLAEALDLEARGDYGNALTSYRLALRERPDDLGVLQNIAIAFSKTGQPEEAIRTYRRALQLDPDLAGAHYGLAFLLLKRSDTVHAGMHLEAYLRTSKADDPQATKFRAHAERTLLELQGAASQHAGYEGEHDGSFAAPDDAQREHDHGHGDAWPASPDDTQRDQY